MPRGISARALRGSASGKGKSGYMVAHTVFLARDVPQEVFYIIAVILDTVVLKRMASRAHGCHREATRSVVEPIRISCQLLAHRYFRELQADSMHCSAEREKGRRGQDLGPNLSVASKSGSCQAPGIRNKTVPEHHEGDVDITRLLGCRCVDEQRGFEESKSSSCKSGYVVENEEIQRVFLTVTIRHEPPHFRAMSYQRAWKA